MNEFQCKDCKYNNMTRCTLHDEISIEYILNRKSCKDKVVIERLELSKCTRKKNK